MRWLTKCVDRRTAGVLSGVYRAPYSVKRFEWASSLAC
jgi:hypothetical protein